jgi:hypothetical protein
LVGNVYAKGFLVYVFDKHPYVYFDSFDIRKISFFQTWPYKKTISIFFINFMCILFFGVYNEFVKFLKDLANISITLKF